MNNDMLRMLLREFEEAARQDPNDEFEEIDDATLLQQQNQFKRSDICKTITADLGLKSSDITNSTSSYFQYHKLREGRARSVPVPRRTRLDMTHRRLPNATSYTQLSFPERVFCGTYSADGNTFLCACQDNYLRVYDTSDAIWRLQDEIWVEDVGWAIVDTCYSPDGEYIVYSTWSDSIGLITVNGNRHENIHITQDGGRICAFSIRFSEGSDRIVAGINGGDVVLVDVHNDTILNHIEYAHEDDINAVDFLDEGTNIFVTGSDDALCKVWDRRMLGLAGACVSSFRGHTHGITFVDGKGDGRYFLSQGKDSTIKLWDIRSGSSPDNVEVPHIHMTDYRFFGGRPGGIRATNRRIRGDISVASFTGHHVVQTLLRARFSPSFSTGQRYIYSASADGCIYIYDILSGETLSSQKVHDQLIRDVHWHPTKDFIASSAWDGKVKTSSHMSHPSEMTSMELNDVIVDHNHQMQEAEDAIIES